jgi:uncharacterized protein
MSIELMLPGVACNLSCPYCYENGQRDAGNFRPETIDLPAAFASLEAEGVGQPDAADPHAEKHRTPFLVFGGEPLLAPLAQLESVFAWGLEKAGANGIQTNGALITDAHLALFEKYRVAVGISVDGPDELNDTRWAGSLEKTRTMTARSLAAIDQLCARKRPPGIIVTLTRVNASAERRPRFKAWLRELHAKGINWIRLHILEVDHALVAAHYALTDDETVEAVLDLAALETELPALQFELLSDMRSLLLALDSQTPADRDRQAPLCVWGACDPLTTNAVRAVDADGGRSNCGRVYKDGVPWQKADAAGFERYLALYHTPQAHGGCAGCRFFAMCKGQCPGTAIDGDWRNRSAQCRVWFRLFEHEEADLERRRLVPLSKSALRGAVEQQLLAAWAAGHNVSLTQALAAVTLSQPRTNIPHGDVPHADVAHGDVDHGDHTDANVKNDDKYAHCPIDPPPIAHHDHSGSCRFSPSRIRDGEDDGSWAAALGVHDDAGA